MGDKQGYSCFSNGGQAMVASVDSGASSPPSSNRGVQPLSLISLALWRYEGREGEALVARHGQEITVVAMMVVERNSSTSAQALRAGAVWVGEREVCVSQRLEGVYL